MRSRPGQRSRLGCHQGGPTLQARQGQAGGKTAALNSEAFVNGGDSAKGDSRLRRNVEEITTGEKFVVSGQWLKSKGSACDAPDALDGRATAIACARRRPRRWWHRSQSIREAWPIPTSDHRRSQLVCQRRSHHGDQERGLHRFDREPAWGGCLFLCLRWPMGLSGSRSVVGNTDTASGRRRRMAHQCGRAGGAGLQHRLQIGGADQRPLCQ